MNKIDKDKYAAVIMLESSAVLDAPVPAVKAALDNVEKVIERLGLPNDAVAELQDAIDVAASTVANRALSVGFGLGYDAGEVGAEFRA